MNKGVLAVYRKRGAALKAYQRRLLGVRCPGDMRQIEEAVRRYEGNIAHLPLGFHAGYQPQVLKQIGWFFDRKSA
jgi:hypothetical protein